MRDAGRLNSSLVSTIVAVLVGLISTSAGHGAEELTETPLAARSGPRGATLFATLPAEQTGIVTENDYADPRMWNELYQELAFGAIGTGVAIGDYDNDGRPDVFVVSKAGRSRLFRNLGGWQFEDVTDRSGIGPFDTVETPRKATGWFGGGGSATPAPSPWKQGATFADVNNDGFLDLYVTRFGAPNWLFINRGDGTFSEEAGARGLGISDASGVAAFGDYDLDGWLDVYVQTNMLNATTHPEGQPDYLLRNNGDGTFTDVTASAGIAGRTCGHSALWFDHDNDGWPDLLVANDYAVPNFLYRNNRDGTFTEVIDSVTPAAPYYAMASDQGDVNNDGRLDLFVADMLPTTHEKDQRGMAASRALNRENKEGSPAAPQYMRNMLYLATGAGHYLEAAQLAGLAATDWTWSVRFEDLDDDGYIDLHVTNGMSREYHNVDILQRIMASENILGQRALMRASPALEEPNLAFRNLGDLRFESVGPQWGLDQPGVSFGAAFGDLDGDGDLDLVYGNYGSGATVLRNDNDTGHRITVALRSPRLNRFGIGATVRLESASGVQVRQLVLARGYLSSSEPVLHFGLGEDARIDRLTVSWPRGHTQVFQNLPVDRHFVIQEPDPETNRAEAPPSAETTFAETAAAMGLSLQVRETFTEEPGAQPLLPGSLNRRGPALAIADLDGDGDDDIVLGGTVLDPARILRRGADGTYDTLALPTPAKPQTVDDGPLLVFDADGDGSQDILITRGGTRRPGTSADYQPRLLLNDGHGTFRAAPADSLPPLPISAGATAAVDFDRDGRVDVFLGGRVLPGKYPLAPRSALLANRGGRFEDVTETLAPGLREVGMVTSALWTDVDGDGWIDLLIALEWGGIRYWRNRDGRGFEDRSEQAGFTTAGTGWWTGLAAADFNGDGRLDYVAGNVGLNTRYHATPEHPALLFHGAFSTGNVAQIIEARYENDRLVPWRTRKELGARIPAVLRRFPLNDAFASATLPEILGEEKLAAARRFAATELRSGVLLSQPDGTFHFSPLPRIAQIAPFQGVVAGDFDGDGHADIYAVQNSHAPDPAVGRFTGGLSQLLRGDGRGGFTPVEAATSGLVVPGDAKALVMLDLDGDNRPDFLATRNGQPMVAFHNTGASDRGSLRVSLRAPAAAGGAAGARVTVELSDGSRQVGENHAGSGYLSQSSSDGFFGIPSGVTAHRVLVRWIDGTESVHAVAAGANSLVISKP